MRIELIAPARKEALARSKRLLSLAPPLNLATVAALTPPEIEVSITDENLVPIDFNRAVDLVGITAVTPTAFRAYDIADAFRDRGSKVVLGGIHPTMLPEEASQHADSVVLGEAEGIWRNLIEDFKAGELKSVYRNRIRPSLGGMPWPRRDLFAKKGYVFRNTISTTRGCPFSCSFCSVTSFFGHTYRSRPIDEIVQEIDPFDNRRPIFFVDDNIAGNPRRAKQLFSALIPYSIKWVGQASLTLAEDAELLKLAAASGCVGLFIGFESIYPASLASVGKKFTHVDGYEQAVSRIHSHGIVIYGSFIFGLDHDDQDVFERTVRFAQKVKLEAAQFNLLVPYPGTRAYEDLDRDGRILTKDWSQYHMDTLVFEPRLMSPKTLQEGHEWAWREFYSLSSILKRVRIVRPSLSHLAIVLGINWNYRRGLQGKVII
jgi:radical SAM superfamily enzyme YgiQ (UPF0313 family)